MISSRMENLLLTPGMLIFKRFVDKLEFLMAHYNIFLAPKPFLLKSINSWQKNLLVALGLSYPIFEPENAI